MRKNLPNQLTIARLVLAGVFFAVLNGYRYPGPDAPRQTGLLLTAIALFIIAALTDMLDGYLARRWQAITLFGRVMDPVCDKILVIGAFIYLAGPRFILPPADPNPDAPLGLSLNMVTGVYPWMVVLILLRELLVTSIRAAMESKGLDFSARWAGKWKMILQSVTVPLVLAVVWIDPLRHPWTGVVRDLFVYATVVITIISGIPYLTGASKALKGRA